MSLSFLGGAAFLLLLCMVLLSPLLFLGGVIVSLPPFGVASVPAFG